MLTYTVIENIRAEKHLKLYYFYIIYDQFIKD